MVCAKANNTDWYMKLDGLLHHILPVLVGNAGLQYWYKWRPSDFVRKKGNADQSITAIQFIDGNVTVFKVDEMKKVHE